MKQAIVVRTDLGMGKGKIAAQVAHAAVSAYVFAETFDPMLADKWMREGAKKVVLKVDSEKELLELFEKAKAKGLPRSLIRDAGLTQIPPGTITAIAIGPEKDEKVDAIVGHLKLL